MATTRSTTAITAVTSPAAEPSVLTKPLVAAVIPYPSVDGDGAHSYPQPLDGRQRPSTAPAFPNDHDTQPDRTDAGTPAPSRWNASASGHDEDARRSRESQDEDALGEYLADLVDVKLLGSIGRCALSSQEGDGRELILSENRGGRAWLVGRTCSDRRSERLNWWGNSTWWMTSRGRATGLR